MDFLKRFFERFYPPDPSFHRWEYVAVDDVTRMAKAVGVRCRRCGSSISTSITHTAFRADRSPSSRRLLESVYASLLKRLQEQTPEDCEEARRLNLVREVQES